MDGKVASQDVLRVDVARKELMFLAFFNNAVCYSWVFFFNLVHLLSKFYSLNVQIKIVHNFLKLIETEVSKYKEFFPHN